MNINNSGKYFLEKKKKTGAMNHKQKKKVNI